MSIIMEYSYLKNIEVYEIVQNFNTPLASDSKKRAMAGYGDHVVIIDNQVYIRDWNDEREEQFAEALYDAEFVRINPGIFKKII